MRKMLPWTFQDFNFDMLKCCHFLKTPKSSFFTVSLSMIYSKSTFFTVSLTIVYSKSTFFTVFFTVVYSKSIFSRFQGPSNHLVVYVLPAGAFFSGKNTPLEFWSMYLVDFVDFCRFEGPSKHPVVYVLPAGAFFSQKTRPWNFGACILWIL